jgi:formylglycine-generating enzyme required for sulfatase activity
MERRRWPAPRSWRDTVVYSRSLLRSAVAVALFACGATARRVELVSPGVDATSTSRADAATECADTPSTPQSTAVDGMIEVPRGVFRMGSERRPNEAPRHCVALERFLIDRTEVSVAEYDRCIAAHVCAQPERCGQKEMCAANDLDCQRVHMLLPEHPMECVDWYQAGKYCRWQGKRLPTEQEWEFAARGTDGRTYPWGNDPINDTRACWREGRYLPCRVASTPEGASPFGVLDMSGNVAEWTNSRYSIEASSQTSEETYVVRGGGYRSFGSELTTTYRIGRPAHYYDGGLGFRCAK